MTNSLIVCGAYQHSWRIRWRKRDPAGPNGDYVLQHTVKTYEVFDCMGNDVTIAAMIIRGIPLGIKDGGKTLDFWEAWQFSPNKIFTDDFENGFQADDTFGDSPFPKCTKGKATVKALYTEVAGRVPFPPMLKPNPQVSWAGEAWASLNKPPHVPKGPFRRHELTVGWDCCCD